MGKSSSADLRLRIVGAIESGGSCRSVARRFGVAPSTAVRLVQRKARTGSLAPARQGRPAGSGQLAAHVEVLVGWVEADGDITMPELAARLLAERGGESAPGIAVAVAASARLYRQKKRCWRAKPIALILSAGVGYGRRIASLG